MTWGAGMLAKRETSHVLLPADKSNLWKIPWVKIVKFEDFSGKPERKFSQEN